MEPTIMMEDLDSPPQLNELLLPYAGHADDLAEHEIRLKLSYHFGGLNVALRETERGLEVVASGPAHEVANVLNTMDPKELDGISTTIPLSWEKMLARYVPAWRRMKTENAACSSLTR
jgi:hypothetical protein